LGLFRINDQLTSA